MTDAIAELLLRHELGDFPPRVRARLEDIFRADPPDAMQRLARAAEYLGLDGVTKETLARADAASRSRTPASEKSGTTKRKNARKGERGNA